MFRSFDHPQAEIYTSEFVMYDHLKAEIYTSEFRLKMVVLPKHVADNLNKIVNIRHYLDNGLTDDGEVVILTRARALLPTKVF
jgi:hypothetical protein